MLWEMRRREEEKKLPELIAKASERSDMRNENKLEKIVIKLTINEEIYFSIFFFGVVERRKLIVTDNFIDRLSLPSYAAIAYRIIASSSPSFFAERKTENYFFNHIH
jgi:hypothetical protein